MYKYHKYLKKTQYLQNGGDGCSCVSKIHNPITQSLFSESNKPYQLNVAISASGSECTHTFCNTCADTFLAFGSCDCGLPCSEKIMNLSILERCRVINLEKVALKARDESFSLDRSIRDIESFVPAMSNTASKGITKVVSDSGELLKLLGQRKEHVKRESHLTNLRTDKKIDDLHDLYKSNKDQLQSLYDLTKSKDSLFPEVAIVDPLMKMKKQFYSYIHPMSHIDEVEDVSFSEITTSDIGTAEHVKIECNGINKDVHVIFDEHVVDLFMSDINEESINVKFYEVNSLDLKTELFTECNYVFVDNKIIIKHGRFAESVMKINIKINIKGVTFEKEVTSEIYVKGDIMKITYMEVYKFETSHNLQYVVKKKQIGRHTSFIINILKYDIASESHHDITERYSFGSTHTFENVRSIEINNTGDVFVEFMNGTIKIFKINGTEYEKNIILHFNNFFYLTMYNHPPQKWYIKCIEDLSIIEIDMTANKIKKYNAYEKSFDDFRIVDNEITGSPIKEMAMNTHDLKINEYVRSGSNIFFMYRKKNPNVIYFDMYDEFLNITSYVFNKQNYLYNNLFSMVPYYYNDKLTIIDGNSLHIFNKDESIYKKIQLLYSYVHIDPQKQEVAQRNKELPMGKPKFTNISILKFAMVDSNTALCMCYYSAIYENHLQEKNCHGIFLLK